MNSSGEMGFLPLLSLACEGRESAVKLKGRTEISRASLLDMGSGRRLGLGCCNSFLRAAAAVIISMAGGERRVSSISAFGKLRIEAIAVGMVGVRGLEGSISSPHEIPGISHPFALMKFLKYPSAVSGEGFLARDITFQNTAGPAKHQAVALRVNADLAAVYRCVIDGYQDTLYVHSFRQFYRECGIYGTVDFLFGNAAVIFQGCNIVAKKPLPGQYNVIAAQSRDDPNEETGISIQNCSVLASDELASGNGSTKTYLGRPWRLYSRTVYIESYLGGLVDPAGWTEWVGNQGLDTLYFGEYMNSGPGSGTDGRVTWPGYHIMDYADASNFTASEFIDGDEWLDSTSFPYDDGI